MKISKKHKISIITLFIFSLSAFVLSADSTYVVKNTKLNEMYENGGYIPLELDEYFEDLTYIITHLKPNVVIHRICADAPKDILVAPDWNIHKKWVLNGFEKILKEKDLWQGEFF